MFPLRRKFIEAGSWCCIQRRPAGGRQGWPFLPQDAQTAFQRLFHPILQSKVKLLIDGPRLVFRNPDFRIIRITSGASSSLAESLFQIKKWERTDNLLIHRPHFTRTLLPEKSIFLALSAEIGKLYTDLLL